MAEIATQTHISEAALSLKPDDSSMQKFISNYTHMQKMEASIPPRIVNGNINQFEENKENEGNIDVSYLILYHLFSFFSFIFIINQLIRAYLKLKNEHCFDM